MEALKNPNFVNILRNSVDSSIARNLGLDLIVVVNKTDYMVDLEKDYDYKDEHFDFIQQAVIVGHYISFL